MKRTKRRSEINVTPFVDVLLVLVVIFLVTAPMMISYVPLTLPKGAKTKNIKIQNPIVLSIVADGRLYVDETEITSDEMLSEELLKKNAKIDDTIYIRGATQAVYGEVMIVMNKLRKLQYQVSLVTEKE